MNTTEPLIATPIIHEGQDMMLLNREPIVSDTDFEMTNELGFPLPILVTRVDLNGLTVKVGTWVKNVFDENWLFGGSIYTIRHN